ncbi:MAG: hypothetical protein ACMUJM_03935 [bacterium]
MGESVHSTGAFRTDGGSLPDITWLYSKQGVYQSKNFVKEPLHRVYIRSWLNLSRNFYGSMTWRF